MKGYKQMNKQAYFPMSNDVALDFILYVIQPDNPPLGYPFGWIQPSEDSTITLGSIYLSCDVELSLKDLIYGEMKETYKRVKDYWEYVTERENKDFIFTDKDTAYIREAIREMDGSNTKQRINGIWECENIHCLYSDLERDEKLLYRLSILGLNTMTDVHNWCCSYLEYLAYNHYSLSEHGKLWHIYEADENRDVCERISDLIPYCDNIPSQLGFYGQAIDNETNDECYHYFNKWGDDNVDTQEWVKSLLESFDNRLEPFDIREYDREVISTLSAVIEWIKDSWNESSLTLSYSDNMPTSVKNWFNEFTSQEILPGLNT